MRIEMKGLEEIKPYEKNPRKNDKAVEKVAESIKEFGFKVPIVIDKNNKIVAGHTRYKASEQLGLEKVPCIVADDLSEEQVKAFRIADNKVTEIAEWDNDLLLEELEGLEDFFTGFEQKEIDKLMGAQEVNPYTDKVQTPIYDIQGEVPLIEELCNSQKTEYLDELIEQSNVSEVEKDFLRKASKRHLQFNYSKVAEYYAHADPEMQDLMERSALVIIDYDKAIECGFVKLSESIEEMIQEEEVGE